MGGVAKMTAAGLCWLLLGVVLAFGVAAASPETHYYFVIKETKVTRLCHEKTILAVNGQFPGPTIYACKGDVVVVNVCNQGSKNITLHWHGVDQPRNPCDYDRAIVHGAIVISPKDGSAYPYPTPHGEVPIILGEWQWRI
ncbi:unnamed protein product [Miscanthus lutarioriparius]|uniref:Plastocyanin-like domain-containing protein n=1 Tax=Miscanthus lutarioriparius TaxID=422564 RepID=A0A811QL10_9POAL|nr:unnamed protein product [Miscanthus lutarioriparius]